MCLVICVSSVTSCGKRDWLTLPMRSPRRLTPTHRGTTALPTPSCSRRSCRQRHRRRKRPGLLTTIADATALPKRWCFQHFLFSAAHCGTIQSQISVWVGRVGDGGARFERQGFTIASLQSPSSPPSRHLTGESTMKLPRRTFLHLAAGAAALPAVASIAKAQSYPSRPVRIVVGFAPGGPNDINARLIGQWLSERLGQQFIVDNRPGASGNIAMESVVKSPPDGYTLVMVATSSAANATLYDNLP